MNLRTLIVKGLYPVCSDEVQILIDQMQNNPEKFIEMFDIPSYRAESPWHKAMQSGNFELIDHVALRQQLKLLKINYAKQLILEGLIETKEIDTASNTMLTSATMKQAAKDIFKANIDAQFKKDYADYKKRNNL